jgi:hypothetical protein
VCVCVCNVLCDAGLLVGLSQMEHVKTMKAECVCVCVCVLGRRLVGWIESLGDVMEHSMTIRAVLCVCKK